MLKLFCTTEYTGEPIHWTLVSQQADNGVVKSIYEAPSKCFKDRKYHMETIESETLEAQHLRIR